MIELSLLGLHALRGSDGRELTSLPAQPKRFALLACLTLGAGGGYHRRDTLAAMFWPDLDQFAARRALRNTLYHLREALGDNVVVTRGDDAVSVDPAMITCDVARLRAALASGAYDVAVDLYRGELLAGIHFANAGEVFEEWLSRERREVDDLVMQAVRALVERDERAGNFPAAAYWAQRAGTIVPGDESWLRRAMALFDRAHDSGSALRLYDAFVLRLASEFRTRPSAETEMLAARIRAENRRPPLAEAATPPIAIVAPAAVDLAIATPHEPKVDSPVVLPVVPPRRRRWPVPVLVTVAAIAVLGGTWWLRSARAGDPAALVGHRRVLVSVFDNRTGDPALVSLGRMTQDWIAQGILRTALVDVVDPRAANTQSRTATGSVVDPVTLAHRTGAAFVVSGSYYRSGDTLLFQAALMDIGSGRIVRAIGPILAAVKTPVAALDELRSRVMTALSSVVDIHAAQDLDHGEVPPFDAYQPYVEGWDAFWHGDRRRAQALFLQAATRDTAFAPAAAAAATTAANGGDCGTADSLAQRFDRPAQHLERVDRLTFQIAVALCHGHNDELLRLALERADLEPATSSLQISAAAAALWTNRPARALAILKRVNPATDLGWSTDTTHFDYWSDVTEALHLLGRHDEELAMANRVPLSAPLSRAWMRGRALAALGRPSAALAVIDSALPLPVEMPNVGLAPYTEGRPQYTATPGWVADWIAHELAVHGDTVAAHQAAERGMAWYRSRSLEERGTVEERIVAIRSLELLGDYDQATRLATELAAADSNNVDYQGMLASLAAEQGDTAQAATLDRWLAAQPVARVAWSALIYRARLAALMGRPDDAVLRTRDARDAGAWPLWIHLDPAFASVRRRPDFVALMTPRE
ncbi:MAG TPA: BTAD domain-containing putative transcriptional regulator [Gemmatimonadales bacterium]|jgi:DNA-binding SARP family transcriptional activator/TolB-like protein